MSLLVSSSNDADSNKQDQASVPPLFAGPLREDLAERIAAALTAGDHEKAAVLLREAEQSFPSDSVWQPLRARCVRLARRKAAFEAALEEARHELSDDRFAAAAGKFRESLALSRGFELLTQKACREGVEAAEQNVQRHWRFAEVLLREVSGAAGQTLGSDAAWNSIEAQRREDCIRVALEESGRAEHTAYLPHLRDRLTDLATVYPATESLESRLRVLDRLVAQSIAEEREKSLRRLMLFRDRLDLTANPETLYRFNDLVAPFVDAYRDDAAFLAVTVEIRDLRSKYESASLLLADNRLQDVLLICDQMLQRRPANVLFCALEEKAKGREWSSRVVNSATQRARVFEENAQYAEALDEWESLREIEPRYPGLVSEIFHCAALKAQAEVVRTFHPAAAADETALTPEIIDIEPVREEMIEEAGQAEVTPAPMFAQAYARSRPAAARLRIAITAEAWNNLKTGLAAALAVLLVVLVFAASRLY